MTMKKTVMVIAGFVLVLAGCAAPRTAERESLVFRDGAVDPTARVWFIRNDPFVAAFAKPIRLYPTVYVDNGKVVVDTEPIHVIAGEGQVTAVKIEWSIGDSGYYFADDNGVVIKAISGPPPTDVDCHRKGPGPMKTVLACSYKRQAGPAKYLYTITITDGHYPYVSDPYIAND
jgi:hypothetical protein